MDWRTKRQMTIAFIVLSPFVLIGAVWLVFLTPERQPTCSDGLKNGEERGVDCGPTCGRVCAFEASQPVAVWTRTLERSTNVYDVVSLISLPRAQVVAENVPYTLRFYDSDGILLLEEGGVTDLPARDSLVLIRQGLNTGARAVARAVVVFPEEVDWRYDLEAVHPSLSVRNAALQPVAAGTRLDIKMQSAGNRTFTNVDLLVLLFDTNGNLFEYTTTFLPLVRPEEEYDAVLTWPTEPEGLQDVQVYPLSYERVI